MPSRYPTLSLIVLLSVFSLLSAPVLVGTSSAAWVSLHLENRTARGICDPPAEGGAAPYDVRVTQYDTSGEVGISYNAYLIVVAGEGMAGLSCGIDYDPLPAQGVDIFGWTLCADLEFPNEGPNGVWPAAGGGNRLTFDATLGCPGATVPGYESEGTFTIFGSLYVYAYGDDQLRVIENRNLQSGPELTLGRCDGSEVDLPTTRGGWIAFSADGTAQGCNPVLGPCDEFTPPPECSVQPDTLDFGDVQVGQYADRSFTIDNIGGGVLSGTVSPGCGDFLVIANGGAYAIGETQTRLVTVRFLPQTEGPHACSLDLGNTSCGEVVCIGNGLPGTQPECSVSPDSLDFGEVLLGANADRSVVLTNTGTTTLSGLVIIDGPYYSIVSGGGAYSLAPGASRTVTVRFAPLSAGAYACTLYVSSVCGPVTGTGTGDILDYPICSLTPDSLDFGEVYLGDSADLSFTITNVGASILTGTVASDCGDFHVVSGAGSYSLGPTISRTVTVRYVPSVDGPTACSLTLGSAVCSDMTLRGTGVVPPYCLLSPETLDFGSVAVGESADLQFTVTNTTSSPLDVTIDETCGGFSIVSGGGAVTLQPELPHPVVVRFSPVFTVSYSCPIEITGGCGNVLATGQGWSSSGGGGTQDYAVVALHAQIHPQKGDEPCATDPVSAAIPCTDFTDHWPLYNAADVYLVVAQGNPATGIGALSCGILYNGEDVGGWTMNDGSGVDLYSWTFCASGLQFTNGPTGLIEDEWPASGGGIRLTWDVTYDCQTTVVGYQGIHAVAGVFYIYAYTDDFFRVTANNNLVSGPEFQVADCNYSISNLGTWAAGSVGFGSDWGYNPCSVVPVKLLSFTAERSTEGAVLEWKTASASTDHLGFEVYRGADGGGRELISDGLLSGRTEYTFTDPAPPATETEYWLAERSRTGGLEWHGPALLPAAAFEGRLALTQAPNNPFVTSTRFSFRLPAAGEVRVSIYDMSGREVARPFSGYLSPGEQTVEWNGRDARGRRLSAGAYVYRVETDFGALSGKVIRLQ